MGALPSRHPPDTVIPQPSPVGRAPFHPDVARFLQSMCGVHDAESVGHGRALLGAAQSDAYHPLRLDPASVVQVAVPLDGGDTASGATASAWVVRALRGHDSCAHDALLPAIVYAHGAFGCFATHERVIRRLAHCTGAAVVFVDCVFDEPWPAAERHVSGVLAWLAACGDRVGVDGTRLALAGDGIGAHVATSAALAAATDPDMGPRVRAQMLVCPLLDTPQHIPFDDDKIGLPWTTSRALQCAWDAYAPHGARSPLAVTASHARHLPPTLVLTAERDIAAPHGHAYGHALVRAGVPVQVASYPVAFHDFWVLDALADTPAAAAATDLVAHFVTHAFAH
ncbi:Esterase/lipase [Pandoravirus dulcis]|uniref:Esterase/lipase n=1 Tax=Pandoravirus dulcis TaxID=1349409 RepID=S4VSP0_9VIRU|nr:Esterase/lipase [Pandoravirus dulcis]AGO83322.1 Esterase/lipase [Pandoravirus dulcis]